MDIIKTDTFEVPVKEFLEASNLQPQEFREIWQDAEWELLNQFTTKKEIESVFSEF